jgi:hypothetical protein
VKRVDHAVTDEPVMIMVARRELRIGAVAVKRAGEISFGSSPRTGTSGASASKDSGA